MSRSKHTPGPWWIKKSPVLVYDYAIMSSGAPILAETFGRDAHGGRPPADEEEANARLIAKSPEMYDLLKDLIDLEGPQPGNAAWAKRVADLLAEIEGATP